MRVRVVGRFGGLRSIAGDTASARAVSAVVLWLVLLLPSVVWAVDGRLAELTRWELSGPPLVLAVAVALDRRLPLVSFALVVAATVFDPLSPLDRFTLAVMAFGYLLAARESGIRTAVVAFGVVVPAGMLGGFAMNLHGPAWVWAYGAVVLPVVTVCPWLLGRYRRRHRELVLGGWARAEEMELARQAELRRARSRERARIAHDMHDSLGHELGLLTLRAGRLELDPTLAEHHRDEVGELRSGVGAATERLRDIIGVLSEEPEPAEPVREDLTGLVERAWSSGMTVRLATEGEVDDLPPMARHAVHRVVQEALTNAAKHAPGAAVTVRVAHRDATTVVTVTNRMPVTPVLAVGSGHFGLVGLQERVRLAGGSFEAGDGGGVFTVVARLPHANGGADHPPTTRRDPSAIRSLSALRRDRARRRARRGFGLAFGVPAVFGLVVVLAGLGSVYQVYSSVLSPADYARIHLDQPETEVRRLLPVHTYTDLPDRLRQQAPPAAARCEYYVSDADLLATDTPIYRLCFRGGHLVAKDALARP